MLAFSIVNWKGSVPSGRMKKTFRKNGLSWKEINIRHLDSDYDNYSSEQGKFVHS